MKRAIFLLLLITSCASPSPRSEGEMETRKLALLLSEIETKDQLQKKLSKIQTCYSKIADLVVRLRQIEGPLLDSEPSDASEALFIELARLYEMPGCRRLLETAQEEAVRKLRGL